MKFLYYFVPDVIGEGKDEEQCSMDALAKMKDMLNTMGVDAIAVQSTFGSDEDEGEEDTRETDEGDWVDDWVDGQWTHEEEGGEDDLDDEDNDLPF